MMKPETARRFNVTLGSLLLFLGALALGVGAFTAMTPAPAPKPLHVELPKTVLQSCSAALLGLNQGFQPVVSNNSVFVMLPKSSEMNYDDVLAKATLAMTVCKLGMTEFCFGESCPRPGELTMRLGYEGLTQVKKTQ